MRQDEAVHEEYMKQQEMTSRHAADHLLNNKTYIYAATCFHGVQLTLEILASFLT